MSKKKKLLAWSLVLCWMLCIFCFSHEEAETSSARSEKIVQVVEAVVQAASPASNAMLANLNMQRIVRKTAHALEYAVLALLLCNALRHNSDSERKRILLSIAIAVCYAITDEVHQLSVAGRDGKVMDVAIDTLGALFGIGVAWLIGLIRHVPRSVVDVENHDTH